MSDIALLQTVKGYVNAAGLDAGYVTRYLRWTDAGLQPTDRVILYRGDGEGSSDVLLQQQDVRLMVIVPGADADLIAGDTTIHDMQRLFRESITPPSGITRFEVLAGVTGPYTLEDGRHWWEMIVRCYTEDQ